MEKKIRTLKATTRQVKEALLKTNGLVAQAAELCGISRQVLHKRINDSKELTEWKLLCEDRMLDKAENVLFEAVENRDMESVRFYLKTKGKKRGYTEKQSIEHSGPDGGPIELKADLTKLSDEELAMLEHLLGKANCQNMQPSA